MPSQRNTKKYGKFLSPTDVPEEKSRTRRPVYMSPLYVRHSMELNAARKTQRKRSHFFDVEREYGDFIDDSDSELSDAFFSDSSYHPSECGELTDHSDADRPFTRRKQQRKQQSSKSNMIEKSSLTDTDDENVKNIVPRRKKSSIRNKNRTESADTNELSWTDSGVSLSRTDQSRNGTLRDTPSQRKVIQELSLQKSRSGSVPSDHRLQNKETIDFRRRVRSHTDGKQIPTIKFERSSMVLNETSKVNRCSFVTDRSSLTNVTNLSTNDLTAVSSESNSDVKIEKNKPDVIPETTDIPLQENVLSSSNEQNPEENSAEKNEKVVLDTVEKDKEACSNAEFVQSSEINSAVSSGNHEINIQINAILGNGFNESKDVNTFAPARDDTEMRNNAKKNKSIISGLRKIAVNFRPRLRRSQKRNLKDLNSNVFIDNMEQRQPKILLNKSAPDERLMNNSETHGGFNDNLQLANLNSLTTTRKRSKSKRLFDRLFTRSRSFSAEKIVHQKLARKSSLPLRPTFNEKSSLNQKASKSLENIGFGANYYNRNSVENLRSFNDPMTASVQPSMSRVHSLNELNTFEKLYSKARSNSTPATPIIMHKNQNAPEICNCEDCVYEEYLEYLAFQEFRRSKCRTYQIQHFAEPNHSVHSLPYISHVSSPYTATAGVGYHASIEQVIAPLDISRGQEREAKTLRTSLYDTFV